MKTIGTDEKVMYSVNVEGLNLLAPTKADARKVEEVFNLQTEVPKEFDGDVEVHKGFRALIDLGFKLEIERDNNKYTLTVRDSEGEYLGTVTSSTKKGLIESARKNMFNLKPFKDPMVNSFSNEAQAFYRVLEELGYTYVMNAEGNKKVLNVYNSEGQLVAKSTANAYSHLHVNMMSAVFSPESPTKDFKDFEALKEALEMDWPQYKEGNKTAAARMRKAIEKFGKLKTTLKRELMEEHDSRFELPLTVKVNKSPNTPVKVKTSKTKVVKVEEDDLD